MGGPHNPSWKQQADQVVNWLAAWFEQEGEDPVLRPVDGQTLANALEEPIPQVGMPMSDVLAMLDRAVLPYLRKNSHPGFMAYVSSSADPLGSLADLIASALNQNLTAWRSAPAAVTLERQTLRWLDDAIGFNGQGHGMFLGGGSSANFHAVSLAIDRTGRTNPPADRRKLCVYWSAETHLSMPKAARVLGVPPEQIRTIPPELDKEAALDWLAHRIGADRSQGLAPSLVCASAGTAGTGRIESLAEICNIAREQDLWFHIDGAYGAPAAMLPEYGGLRDSFGLADSISMDPHKWLFCPIDIGCLLVRDPAATRACFTESADYTQVTQTDDIESFAFFDHSLELTRRFRALKVWMILKLRGQAGLINLIRQNIALRERLDAQIIKQPKLQLLASDLSISNFRYADNGRDVNPDLLNERLLQRLNAEGAFHLSPNRVDGCFALRACIVNANTRQTHVDLLIHETLRIGDQLIKEFQ